MVQEILTYLILVITITISIVKLYKSLFSKKTIGACATCFQAKSACNVNHLKNQGQ